MNWIRWILNLHIHDFRKPVIHKNSYWMKCVNEKCNKVRDSYLADFRTDKIETWDKR